MASAASEIGQGSNLLLHSTKRSIKALSESPDLTSIPSSYAFITNPGEVVSDPHDDPLPIIDYSLLISGTPDQRSKAIHDLGKACEEWGFFMVVNHDIPKTLMEKMFVEVFGFFNLTEEEKQEYAGKHVLDPIRCGTSFNSSVEKVFFWRDFLKIFVHPEFHSPDKPAGFRETCEQYCRRARHIARELLKGISESLGLEPSYIEQALNLDSDFE
ncbi:protein DMR6-LIKE OXYGENASE 2-like [Quillaja saponaria]|uniref:Protein DMR6-LIKE OXYGENASE 2-like n=1 Tax=Quillaja saponaria TaxID=32244 RepID=A0AAD7PU33_QUISA|nr:protein DMR6-LIKE OXYGENASE 2-like [Quillaja saponaria]